MLQTMPGFELGGSIPPDTAHVCANFLAQVTRYFPNTFHGPGPLFSQVLVVFVVF